MHFLHDTYDYITLYFNHDINYESNLIQNDNKKT